MMLLEFKDRPHALPAFVTQAENVLRDLKRKWLFFFVGFLLLAALANTLGWFVLGREFILFGGFVTLMVSFFAFVGRRQGIRRTAAKVDFLRGLVDELMPDLHPRAKVSLALDLDMYNQTRKRTWSGRSIYGNPKFKYSDRWLRMRFRLADYTEVRLVRHAAVKTKSGAIMKEKRRLTLTLHPNPERYYLRESDRRLQKAMLDAVQDSFHDPPEELKIRLARDTAGWGVRLTQLDAPILPREVFAMLQGAYRALEQQKR